jgi:hypothetical protein
MLCKKSILHVDQGMGKCFSEKELKGYFNNLTEKVTLDTEHQNDIDYIPEFEYAEGKRVQFPVTVFQYALGCYDLYLLTEEQRYLQKFKTCAEWALTRQNENGSVDAFSFLYPQAPYGAMCQGQAVSLFVRAYFCFKNDCYLQAAQKAADFMLIPLEDGGTARYDQDDLYLLEYTHLPAVLNGWIFALFGLHDLNLILHSEKYQNAIETTVRTLQKHITEFDCGYWSLYDMGGKIASPFYHRLHIAQLQALLAVYPAESLKKQLEKWTLDCCSFWKPKRAFIKKAIQKILE